jgi:quinol monooxygenase YgiN
MAQALLIVKHPVEDFDSWRTGYAAAQPVRDQHGVTADTVHQDPADPNSVTVLHWFPTADQAQAFAADPGLQDAMKNAGVAGPPRVEIVVEA